MHVCSQPQSRRPLALSQVPVCDPLWRYRAESAVYQLFLPVAGVLLVLACAAVDGVLLPGSGRASPVGAVLNGRGASDTQLLRIPLLGDPVGLILVFAARAGPVFTGRQVP